MFRSLSLGHIAYLSRKEMKRIWLVFLGVLVAVLSWSTSAVAQADTLPSSTNPEPKIIYYESDKNQDSRRSSFSWRRDRNTGRGRIKTLAGSMNHSGGFGALSFKSTRFRDEAMILGGLRGGWIINRTLAIGGEGYGVIPTSRYEDIEIGEEVLALGGYGGMFLELIFFSNEVIHITFPLGAGAGWLGYEYTNEVRNPGFASNTETLLDDDVFWYVEPGVDAELNIARNFRLAFGISKRFTQDLNIVNTDEAALEKLNYFITLKVGSF